MIWHPDSIYVLYNDDALPGIRMLHKVGTNINYFIFENDESHTNIAKSSFMYSDDFINKTYITMKSFILCKEYKNMGEVLSDYPELLIYE